MRTSECINVHASRTYEAVLQHSVGFEIYCNIVTISALVRDYP